MISNVSPYSYPGLFRLKGARPVITIDDINAILQLVASYYEISVVAMVSPCRKRELTEARQVCIWLLRKHTRMTQTAIGHYFGGRDHTTVIHSVQIVNDLMETDRKYATRVNEIEILLINKFSKHHEPTID